MINLKNYRRKKNSTVFLPFVIARLLERKEKCFLKKASVSIAIAKNKIRIILTRNVLHLHEDFKADLKDTKGNLSKQKDTWVG